MTTYFKLVIFSLVTLWASIVFAAKPLPANDVVAHELRQSTADAKLLTATSDNPKPIDSKTTDEAATSTSTETTEEIVPDDLPAEEPIHDPLEKMNRVIFVFNDNIDAYFLKPIAQIYNKIMPKPLNAGIHNAFNNLETITTIANDILQLHIGQTLNDVWRLTINSTVGIGGLFDVGERIGLTPYTNDFGLTLARWGWRNSTYIVLPFFGPNTLRDTIHIFVDYYYLSMYPYIYPRSTRYGLYALSVVDVRAQWLKFENVLEEAAFDRYSFFRSAYIQRRNYRIEENIALGIAGRNTTVSRIDYRNNA